MEQQAYDNMEEGVEAMARQFGAVIGIWLAMAGFSEEVATLLWSGDGEFRCWRWKKLGEAFEDGGQRVRQRPGESGMHRSSAKGTWPKATAQRRASGCAAR